MNIPRDHNTVMNCWCLCHTPQWSFFINSTAGMHDLLNDLPNQSEPSHVAFLHVIIQTVVWFYCLYIMWQCHRATWSSSWLLISLGLTFIMLDFLTDSNLTALKYIWFYRVVTMHNTSVLSRVFWEIKVSTAIYSHWSHLISVVYI